MNSPAKRDRQNEKHGDFHDADRDECQYKAEDPDRRCNDIFPTVIDELERGSRDHSGSGSGHADKRLRDKRVVGKLLIKNEDAQHQRAGD